jgi:hypothetical protein
VSSSSSGFGSLGLGFSSSVDVTDKDLEGVKKRNEFQDILKDAKRQKADLQLQARAA